MYNLLISIAIGVAVSAALALGTNLGLVAAVFPGVLAVAVAYFVLARRSWKRLEALFEAMQKEVQAQKFDKAIQTLQGGFVLAPWQFLVASQLHSNIGILMYLRQDVDGALPHLEKSFSRNWIARGMLGVARYRKRDLGGARKVLDDAVKTNKKEGVLWSAYAWILEKEGRHDEAIAVLSRAVAANASDDKLKSSLQALQNGKKLKLGKLYGEQWFQFMLERPPPEFVGAGFRGGRRALYRP
ncbi:MAG TPA: tetratricopeptide repeat protein [Anaeromyxobacter sp.]|nr:tetratricopeptide repeat protein [Anaeromyxobacter sp.]